MLFINTNGNPASIGNHALDGFKALIILAMHTLLVLIPHLVPLNWGYNKDAGLLNRENVICSILEAAEDISFSFDMLGQSRLTLIPNGTGFVDTQFEHLITSAFGSPLCGDNAAVYEWDDNIR